MAAKRATAAQAKAVEQDTINALRAFKHARDNSLEHVIEEMGKRYRNNPNFGFTLHVLTLAYRCKKTPMYPIKLSASPSVCPSVRPFARLSVRRLSVRRHRPCNGM